MKNIINNNMNELIKIIDNVYALNISKCGCTFLKNVSNIMYNIHVEHDDITKFHIKTNKLNPNIIRINNNFDYENNFIFAVYKDPIKRFFSLYKDIKYGHLMQNSYYEGKINTIQDLITLAEKELMKKVPERHIRKQIDYLNKINVNQIVKIEDLDEYIKFILNKDIKLPHLNSTKEYDLGENVTENLKNDIQNLYKEDYSILEIYKDKIWNKK